MNTKNAKIMSLRAAKERKQKKVALVLGALFVVLLVFQGPRTLKMLHGNGNKSPATTPSAAPAPASGTPATGTPASATPATATSSSTHLPESDVPPARKRSQLFSFELFDSKDPFVQQVSQDAGPSVTTAGTSAPTAASTAPTMSVTAASSSASATPPAHPAASSTSAASAGGTSKAAAVVIEVNGQRQAVSLSQAFPARNPTFKLVSVKGDLAMIGIAGGSLASGKGAIALRIGKALTLMNTSDGQRYELRLVSVR